MKRLPKWLREYIYVWIAVLPAVIIIAVPAYVGTEILRLPIWAMVLLMLIALHIALGWIALMVFTLPND